MGKTSVCIRVDNEVLIDIKEQALSDDRSIAYICEKLMMSQYRYQKQLRDSTSTGDDIL